MIYEPVIAGSGLIRFSVFAENPDICAEIVFCAAIRI